jgi:predicted transcriptional regulator YdeE
MEYDVREPEPYVLRDLVIVDGLVVRTTNADESQPARAKIPALWQRFYQEGHSAAVPGAVYGVYTEYATDASGPYTLVVGGANDGRSAQVEPLVRVQIPAGRYLAFTSKGDVPAAVVAGWQGVWEYFARAHAPRRAYTTDFELYDPSTPYEVRICIAVMSPP